MASCKIHQFIQIPWKVGDRYEKPHINNLREDVGKLKKVITVVVW